MWKKSTEMCVFMSFNYLIWGAVANVKDDNVEQS